MEKILSFAKRRGFFYQSSEIYGGVANCWDFGHYGVLLKENLRNWWLKRIIQERDDIFLIDSSVILNPRVWEASGHVKSFNDNLVDCRDCHYRTRADHLIEGTLKKKVEGLPPEKLTEIIKENSIKCPVCQSYRLTEVRKFNLLFETHIGIIEEKKSKVFLRGELAQGIFMNFKQIVNTLSPKLPFGIASTGVVFRNEITLGQGVFRTLQFDLMEFEYFIRPNEWKKYYQYWQEKMWSMALEIGLSSDKIRWREHEEFERSHYSKKTMDIEYQFPSGWKEIWGLAYRGDFDLSNHMKNSNVDLHYFDPLTGEKFVPHVIEPTFGLSRLILVILMNGYHEEIVNQKKRVVLKIKPFLAPVKVAVFSLQKDEKLRQVAFSLYLRLRHEFSCEFDDSGNIGKMYRRQDEIGTPFCLTIDYQTLDDKTITIRDRDSMKQERVAINKVIDYLKEKLAF
ncbi:MAG: glycine--tRNA ligase [Patescibacteria group bacterium]|nr:glycine--tRNA ligase [Patescibacteria group bacterium]